jgi:RNA polymerase sigma-70 factor (ECF subfamily)
MEFTEQLFRARSGDRQAVDRLMLEWRPWLRSRARGLLGEGQGARVDSSDVVQIAMAEAYRNLSKFRGATEAEWAGWLRGILRCQATRIRRFNAAQIRRTSREVNGSWSVLDVVHTPAVLAVQHERREKLQSAVTALPGPLRDIVRLRIFEEKSFQHISDELGKSPRTVRRRWMQALRLLASYLHERPGESAG